MKRLERMGTWRIAQSLVANVLGLIVLFCFALTANRAEAASGRCQAVADAAPSLFTVAFTQHAQTSGDVTITFVGHSTFRIESPSGIVIATDYAGFAGAGPIPDIVTMNKAQSTHYTDFPDPAIRHVLRGWNPDGGAAAHDLKIGDVAIRNVPTDIRSWSGLLEVDGNSIFIFEVAGLCIGHLGHLHHELGPQHLGWIGRLDIVMVPVDGSYTMAQDAMVSVLDDMQASIIIPMHFFGASTLAAFVRNAAEHFAVDFRETAILTVSEATLPATPTVMVLPGS